MPKFEELPFDVRPDLTPFLIHLTKNTVNADEFSAFDNLVHILKTGKVWGSGSSGFVKGKTKATCFFDVPLTSLKYVLNERDCDPDRPRYEGFGVVVGKKYAYKKGARPVLYLSNSEVKRLAIPADELWRVVRFEVTKDDRWLSWLHEREWRSPGAAFSLPKRPQAVLVQRLADVEKLKSLLAKEASQFKCLPQAILPLSVVCQGLPYL